MKKSIVDNSGQKSFPFPETADEDAVTPGVAIPHESGSNSTSPECKDVKDASEQLVDAHQDVPQTPPSALISSFDDSDDPDDRHDPSNSPPELAKNSERHDGAGSAALPSAETVTITSTDACPGQSPHDGPGEHVVDETPTAGLKPIGCTSTGVSCDDSPDLNSAASSKESVGESDLSIGTVLEPSEPADMAPSKSDEGRAFLNDSTGAVGSNVPEDEQSQKTEASSAAEESEQGAESKQAGQGSSASVQPREFPTPQADSPKPKKRKQSYPKVITEERDYLSTSEEEILDGIIALKREQFGAQSSPTDEVQASYLDLLTKHVTCTKTVQRNISKLKGKGFIVQTEGGKSGSGAKYQVVPEQEVKKKRLEKGLTHYVEIGPGRQAMHDPKGSNEDDD